MSNNPCSHYLANCRATEPRYSALPRLSIAETDNWFRGFLQKCQPTSCQGLEAAGELKRLVLPGSLRQWEQTYIGHPNPRISLLYGTQRVRGGRPGITSSS